MSDETEYVGLWDEENSLGPLVRTEFPNSYYEDLITFWKLIQDGSVEEVRAEIARGMDVNAYDPRSGATALMLVAKYSNDPNMVMCLLDAGASVTDRDKTDRISVIFDGIAKDHRQVIADYKRMNRKHVVQKMEKGQIGLNSLQLALKYNNNHGIIEALLRGGADANTRDGNGISAFSSAIEMGHGVEVIRMLLDHGARINEPDPSGETPLIKAASHDSWPEVINLLLRAGARVNDRDSNGTTAIMKAAHVNTDPEVVRVLGMAGACAEVKDAFGYTPLLYAAETQGDQVIDLLVRFGADVNVRRRDGLTPLMIVVMSEVSYYDRSEAAICRTLIMNGADVNAQDYQGKTALMYAIDSEHAFPDLLNALLDADPDLSLKDADGRTAHDHLMANEDLVKRDPLLRILGS